MYDMHASTCLRIRVALARRDHDHPVAASSSSTLACPAGSFLTVHD